MQMTVATVLSIPQLLSAGCALAAAGAAVPLLAPFVAGEVVSYWWCGRYRPWASGAKHAAAGAGEGRVHG